MKLNLAIIVLLSVSAPAFAGRHDFDACALASQLAAPRLPDDIAVMYDASLDASVHQAMDFWTARLSGVEKRPFVWHRVDSPADCMIHVHMVSQLVLLANDDAQDVNIHTVGLAYMPGAPKYNGIVLVSEVWPWAIAHEIGHLLGCAHSNSGIMQPEHNTGESAPMSISAYEVAASRVVRLQAWIQQHPDIGIQAARKR